MNKTLSPDWEVLLEPFQSLFSKAGFRYLCVFIPVLAHLDERLCVTKVVLSGLLGRHWTNFHRFLRSPAWNPADVARQIFTLCLPVCQDAEGRVFVALDDTVCKKHGTHFDGLGVHYDPINLDHPRHLSHGHCFVALALLTQQLGQQAVALFVSCALYVPEKVCGNGRAYESKLALARGLVANLPVVSHLVAVCDGAYAKHNFVRPVADTGRFVLSRLRRDAVFYDPPPPRQKGQRGAPRKFGAKHKAAAWAAQEQDWQSACLFLYGRQRHLLLKSRLVLLRSLDVSAHLVAVRWATGKTVFLFSTDLRLSAEQMVRAYASRFAIETGFRDAKQSFGLSTYQVRNETGFTRLVHLCFWSQTLLRLRCWYQRPTQDYGGWRKKLAYLTLSQQKRLSQSQDGFFAVSGRGFMDAKTT
jgi:hypothetical protein